MKGIVIRGGDDGTVSERCDFCSCRSDWFECLTLLDLVVGLPTQVSFAQSMST